MPRSKHSSQRDRRTRSSSAPLALGGLRHLGFHHRRPLLPWDGDDHLHFQLARRASRRRAEHEFSDEQYSKDRAGGLRLSLVTTSFVLSVRLACREVFVVRLIPWVIGIGFLDFSQKVLLVQGVDSHTLEHEFQFHCGEERSDRGKFVLKLMIDPPPQLLVVIDILHMGAQFLHLLSCCFQGRKVLGKLCPNQFEFGG